MLVQGCRHSRSINLARSILSKDDNPDSLRENIRKKYLTCGESFSHC